MPKIIIQELAHICCLLLTSTVNNYLQRHAANAEPYMIVDVPEKFPSCNEQYCHHIFQKLSLVCILAVQTRANQQRPSLMLWPKETGLLPRVGFLLRWVSFPIH
ncbi:unnamed protein product [Clavelina lepadiformis]|uniref:Secreted protein n=1 Tax=Clavelina lepadiformis TaxID=159417 RepID=A0ABP0GCM8_CLALP